MFYDSCFVNEVTDFRKLRTGKKRMKVVAADECRRILFIARVFQNRPFTTGKLRFDNGKSFDLNSRTIRGQRASLFFWTEDLEQYWIRQSKIDETLRWLESAKPEDVVVCADLVAEAAERPRVKHHPLFTVLAKQQVVRQLKELGLVQLRGIAGMLYAGSERLAS